MKYDNFFLPAHDMEKSRSFYQDVLGMDLKFDFSDKGMVAYNVGEEEPALILKDISKFPGFKPTIWFEVDNVQEKFEELKRKGINFLSIPFRIGTGWAVELLDPAGNRLGFTDYRK